MAHSITPFLMFQGGVAEEALRFYADVFAGAQIRDVERFGPGEQGPEGTIKQARLTIAGQDLRFFDSPVAHAFDFTPSLSLFVTCADEAELRKAWDSLAEGGEALMPLDNYGFSRMFGWVNDRFGVSWQLDLP